MGCGWAGESIGTLWSLREQIGEIQFGSGINDVRNPMRHRHLDELRVGR
jgi:hypothetical protein